MRAICTSDIHGKPEKIAKLKDVSADLIIISGDITHFGNKERTREVVDDFLKINKVLAVHGNCDQCDVNEALEEAGINLHSKGLNIAGVGFFGVGGSNPTPFNTPQEYSEEEIGEFLSRGHDMVKNLKKRVLVSHSPPYNTKVDYTPRGVHAGSKKLREFIEKHQPDLVICGHIHEARGIDKIGKTLIVNPGAFHMGFAIIDIGEKIKVELCGL